MENLYYIIGIVADIVTIVAFLAGVLYFGKKYIFQDSSRNKSHNADVDTSGHENIIAVGDGNTIDKNKN